MRGIVGYTGVQSAAPMLPEGFLCANAVLRLMTGGIVVNEKVIRKAAEEDLPFIAAENIMMEAVRRGGDRQKIHGIIRRCSIAAAAQMKNGSECYPVVRMCEEKELGVDKADLSALLQPERYVGRCEKQAAGYISGVRTPIAGSDRVAADIEN